MYCNIFCDVKVWWVLSLCSLSLLIISTNSLGYNGEGEGLRSQLLWTWTPINPEAVYKIKEKAVGCNRALDLCHTLIRSVRWVTLIEKNQQVVFVDCNNGEGKAIFFWPPNVWHGIGSKIKTTSLPQEAISIPKQATDLTIDRLPSITETENAHFCQLWGG